VAAKRREEEAKAAAAKKRKEVEVKRRKEEAKAAAAKKHKEEEAKRREEEANADAAKKRKQEIASAANKRKEEIPKAAAAAKKRKSADANRREDAAKSDAAAKSGQSKGNVKAKKSKEAKGTSPKSKIPSTNATSIRYNGKNVPERSTTGFIGNVQHEVSQILTVGKGAAPSDLKTVVEMIPKDIICEIYKCTFSSFEDKINEKLASAQDFSSTGEILYRVLKKFLVWTVKTKGEEDTSKKRKAKEEAKEEEIEKPISRKKKKLNHSSKLTSLIVPNATLEPYFGKTLKTEKQTCFRIKDVRGDGNCLYRSLSISRLFKSRYPSLSGNHIEVRQRMQKFAIENESLSRLIHRHCWNDQEDYDSWIESLVKSTTWAGPAEYTLFAYCFEIHVLCISVLSPKVLVHSSIGKQEIRDESASDFAKKPLCESEVIFIWHHNCGDPTLFLGKESGIDDAKIYNHYALLEKMTDSETIDPERCLTLTHVDEDDRTVVTLLTPDKSKVKEAVSQENAEHDTQNNQSLPTQSDLEEDEELPDPPFACRIYKEADWVLHFDDLEDRNEFHFSVLDNVGKGDCFYESILNSVVFQKRANKVLANDIQSLRDELKKFGLNNPEFSREVYNIFYDVNDVAEHSVNQMWNSLWTDDWKDTEWLFDDVRTIRSILDLIGIKGETCAVKTVRNKLQKLHQDDDDFLKHFIREYLTSEQRKKLGWLYWLHGVVGTMGEFAGNAEMVLFTRLFGLYIAVVKNTVGGPEIQSSRMFFHQKDLYPFSNITCEHSYVKEFSEAPATIENTIIIWNIDPKDPCTAYKGGHVCEHYVTLNWLKPTDPFVCPDMFTFARKPTSPPKKKESEDNSSKEESSETEPSEKESSEMEPSEKEKEPAEKEPSEKESEKKKEPSEKDSLESD
jgi:hypothetical protein